MKSKQAAAEQEVLRISATLRELSDAQREWMQRKALKHHIFKTSKSKCWCSHCGKEFPATEGRSAVCPHCGQRAGVVPSRRQKYDDMCYCAFLTTSEGWQIVRYYLTQLYSRCDSTKKYDYAVSYYHTEVMRLWFNPETGQKVMQRVNLCSFPNYRKIPYDLSSKIRIERRVYSGGYGYYCTNYNEEWFVKKVYPYGTILPFFRKRGVSIKSATEVFLDKYCDSVMTNEKPLAETCVKAGQYLIANHILDNTGSYVRNETSIKIALRHGYRFDKQIHSLRDYDDYLYQLEELGLDIRNPHYICPDDFREAHTRMTERLRRKREEEERRENERRILEDKKAAEEFAVRIQRYAGLVIAGYGITIKPLMSVEEFAEEGASMHHCVFENGYYKRPKCLILSAKKGGKRVETIEVNLNTFKVSQSRGVNNTSTEYHEQILSLMSSNMGAIRKRAQA